MPDDFDFAVGQRVRVNPSTVKHGARHRLGALVGTLAFWHASHLGKNLGTKRGETTQNRCDAARRAGYPNGVDLRFDTG